MGERRVCFTYSAVFDFIEARFAEVKTNRSRFGTLLQCRVCELTWCLFHDDDDSYFLRLTPTEAKAVIERDEWKALFQAWLENSWGNRRSEMRKTFRWFSVNHDDLSPEWV